MVAVGFVVQPAASSLAFVAQEGSSKKQATGQPRRSAGGDREMSCRLQPELAEGSTCPPPGPAAGTATTGAEGPAPPAAPPLAAAPSAPSASAAAAGPPAGPTTIAAAAAGKQEGGPGARSPDTVTGLLASAAAGPATPTDGTAASGSTAPASAASTGRQAASPRPLSPSPTLSRSNSHSNSLGERRSQGSSAAIAADLQAAVAAASSARRPQQPILLRGGSNISNASSSSILAAAASSSLAGAAAAAGGRGVPLDIDSLVARLRQRPLTGQVAAWGWDAAAKLSGVRRTMPAQLFSALWPATEACVQRMMPQDVLEMMESWLTLMHQCPRHFRLSPGALQAMATYALPTVVKRMGQDQLAQLAVLARDIALHRSDADLQVSSARQAGSSARDLMQPVFALVAAETAWRCNNQARYVSPETVSAVVTAAPAWSWRVVRHRDSQSLASLKLATAAALEELMPHSPRDLPPSAFGKLKTDSNVTSPRAGTALSGSASGGSRRSSGGGSAAAPDSPQRSVGS